MAGLLLGVTGAMGILNLLPTMTLLSGIINPADFEESKREFQEKEKEESATSDENASHFVQMKVSIESHHMEDRQVRSEFEEDLEYGVLNALSTLRRGTSYVLEITEDTWKANKDKIRTMADETTQEFEKASQVVEKDLDNIAKHSQDAVDAEQQMISFLASLKVRHEVLHKELQGRRAMGETVQNSINGEHNHLEQPTREITDWILFIPIKRTVPNELYGMQQQRLQYFNIQLSCIEAFVQLYTGHIDKVTELCDSAKKLLEVVCEDEIMLMNLKSDVWKVSRDVGYLEVYVKSPDMRFGRIDFIRCVLKLINSEHFERVEKKVGGSISRAKESITSLCKNQLSGKEWEEAQHPYKPDDDDIPDFIQTTHAPKIYEHRPSPILGLARSIGVAVGA